MAIQFQMYVFSFVQCDIEEIEVEYNYVAACNSTPEQLASHEKKCSFIDCPVCSNPHNIFSQDYLNSESDMCSSVKKKPGKTKRKKCRVSEDEVEELASAICSTLRRKSVASLDFMDWILLAIHVDVRHKENHALKFKRKYVGRAAIQNWPQEEISSVQQPAFKGCKRKYVGRAAIQNWPQEEISSVQQPAFKGCTRTHESDPKPHDVSLQDVDDLLSEKQDESWRYVSNDSNQRSVKQKGLYLL
ncbi:uncharacterized protein [Amphiura filiformis]|uniref:uncharacterized protein n=1 Tax=Amphiura filiformis TaxID=82378 RepID=UPI003B2210EE